MNKYTHVKYLLVGTLAAIAGLTASVQLAYASTNASVYVVHGIPGTDLSLPNALPVDISVNGACAIPNFTFTSVAGPVSLAAGSYQLAVSLANPTTPCGNSAILTKTVQFHAGENASVVAHLTDGGAPTLSKFTNSVGNRNQARVIAHHTAYAPAVDLVFGKFNKAGKEVERGLSNISNGAQGTLNFRPGDYWAYFTPAGSFMTVFGPAPIQLDRKTTYLVYAVGSLVNNTFTLVTKAI